MPKLMENLHYTKIIVKVSMLANIYMFRVITIFSISLLLVGCVAHYHREIFTRDSNGTKYSISVKKLNCVVRLHASQFNSKGTKSFGPYFFSFNGEAQNADYEKLYINSAKFTDSKNHQINLITPDSPVILNFSSERRTNGGSAVFYMSRDRKPLDFEFYEDQKLTLEIDFTVIDSSGHSFMHSEKLIFKALLIDKIGSHNPFFVYLEEDKVKGLKEVVRPNPHNFSRTTTPPSQQQWALLAA